MNRLRNNRCYLSGAMEFMPDLGVQWRDQIKSDLSDLGIVWLDPCKKPTNAINEQQIIPLLKAAREAGQYDKIRELGKAIRHIDLRLVDCADFIIVNLDLSIPTTGTHEEIVTANRSKKPVLVRVVQGKSAAPFWLFWMLPHELIFSTWEEIHTYLRTVDSCDSSPDLNRWLFFDL